MTRNEVVRAVEARFYALQRAGMRPGADPGEVAGEALKQALTDYAKDLNEHPDLAIELAQGLVELARKLKAEGR